MPIYRGYNDMRFYVLIALILSFFTIQIFSALYILDRKDSGARLGEALGEGIGRACEDYIRRKEIQAAYEREAALQIYLQEHLRQMAYQKQLQEEALITAQIIKEQEMAYQQELKEKTALENALFYKKLLTFIFFIIVAIILIIAVYQYKYNK